MIYSTNVATEFYTSERCFIIEVLNDDSSQNVSIARARVEPGVTTELHSLSVEEFYYILEGQGLVEINKEFKKEVNPGDVVRIKEETSQRITNIGDSDLLFLCICRPRFKIDNYTPLE